MDKDGVDAPTTIGGPFNHRLKYGTSIVRCGSSRLNELPNNFVASCGCPGLNRAELIWQRKVSFCLTTSGHAAVDVCPQ